MKKLLLLVILVLSKTVYSECEVNPPMSADGQYCTGDQEKDQKISECYEKETLRVYKLGQERLVEIIFRVYRV